MKRMLLVGMLILGFASPAFSGSLTITIPDSKDAKVVEAKESYNQRNGTSYTVLQYVRELLKMAVVKELILKQQLLDDATIRATETQLQANYQSAKSAVDTTQASESQGW